MHVHIHHIGHSALSHICMFTFITLAIRPYLIYTHSHSSHKTLNQNINFHVFTSQLSKYTSHTTYTIMYTLCLGRIYINHFPMNNSISRHTIISYSNTHKLTISQILISKIRLALIYRFTISRFRIHVWV